MNEVGAKEKDKEQRKNTPQVEIDLHIGVFFDGTNNNANTNEWLDWFKLTSIVEKNHALKNTIKFGEGEETEEKDESPSGAAKSDKAMFIKEPKKYRKNSNPAILSSLFYAKALDENNKSTDKKVLHVYIEGSGANGFQADSKVVDFLINGKAVKGLGFGVGKTGVVAKVCKAIRYIRQRVKKEENNHFTKIKDIHFYVFGFSRGSACARLFSYIVARNAGDNVGKLKKKQGGLIRRDVEKEFDEYLSFLDFKDGEVKFLDNYKGHMTVDFLGIYDTVAAIGFLQDENGDVNGLRKLFLTDTDFWDNFHRENAQCYGLYSPALPSVTSTCHICALDEFRANFALTDIGKAAEGENLELLIPGCHSDVGGGYTDGDKAELKTLKFIYDKHSTRMCIHHPTNSRSIKWMKLTSDLEVLKNLGWIDNTCVEVKNLKDISLGKADKVDIEHTVTQRHQYSNIPLRFMYERASKKIKIFEQLFREYPSEIYPTDKDDMLKKIWDVLKDKVGESGRHFYLAGGDYCSPEYFALRRNYLHFTSTDTLHSFGDPGNPPGRRTETDATDGNTYSDICRLVYRGGKEEDTDVHYMQDYGEE